MNHHHSIQSEMKQKPFTLTFYGMAIYAVLSLTSMALMSLGVGALLFCILSERGALPRFWSDTKKLLSHPPLKNYLKISLLFMSACLLSLLSAKLFPLRFNEKGITVKWASDLSKLYYFILPMVLALGWSRLPNSHQAKVLKIWIYCFGLLSWLGVVQFFTGWPRSQPSPLVGYYHTVLLLGHHLSVASIWIFPFFCLMDAIRHKELLNWIGMRHTLALFFLTGGAFTLFFTYSRTLWVAMPIGILFWCLSQLPRRKAFLFSSVIGILGLAVSQTEIIQRRLQNPMGVQD